MNQTQHPNSSPATKSSEPDSTPTLEHFDCCTCQKSWPEHLMDTDGAQWVCRPCHAKMKAEVALRFKKKGQRSVEMGEALAPKLKLAGWILVFFGLVAAGAYGGYLLVEKFKKPVVVEEKLPKPVVDLGPVVLASALKFRNAPGTIVGSAFFINGPDGVVGATPALDFSGGDSKKRRAYAIAQIDGLVETWSLVPRFAPEKQVAANGLHGPSTRDAREDVWLLDLAVTDPKSLPTTAVVPRPIPAVLGDRLFLLRVLPDDPQGGQETFEARLESTLVGGAMLTVKLGVAMRQEGLQGTPIVDVNGQLVGVVTGFAEAPNAEGRVKAVVAVSTMELFGFKPPPPPKKK